MIMSFLKSLLSKGISFDQPYSNYSKLLEKIRNASLGAQVYHLMQADKHLMELPRFFREKMQKVYFACFVQNLLIKHETESLLQEFERLGIPAIPMKGTYLAERYFGHFAARGTSDIDLLIRPEHMEAATKCIQSKGYRTLMKVNPAHYHFEWVKDAPGLPGPLLVELHWSLAPAVSSRIAMEHAWITSEPLEGFKHIRLMDTTYTFYALCLHGVSHQMDSIRYALDLCQFIRMHAGTIGIKQVMERAEADKTKQRIIAALSITYQLFPELNDYLKLPFPSKYRYWNEDFVQDPSNGRTSYSPFQRMMFTIYTMDSWRFRFLHFLRIAFPTRDIARYSVDDENVPNTLPAIYYRLYKQRFRKIFGGA